MNVKKLLALLLAVVMMLGLVACKPDNPTNGTTDGPTNGSTGGPVVTPAVFKQAEYNTTTAVMPSNWNELTYQSSNDTQILGYVGSNFFDYDYKFKDDVKYNPDGSINKDGIVDGAYTTNYSAALKLEDVTSTVDAKWGYTAEQKAEGGYAWKITLRDDLKWDDGTPITAADFEYSMQAMLDPDFMNLRANSYYDKLRVKNARAYFYKNQEFVYPTVGSQGYQTNAEALADGKIIHIDCYEFYNAQGYVDAEGNACPQWVAYNDETVYNSVDAWADPSNEDIQDAFSGKYLWDKYFAPGGKYEEDAEVGEDDEGWLGLPVVNEERNVTWEDVGLYAIESENAVVICMDKAFALLMEDGSLSYLAAYNMDSLPLVKRDLYEKCKIKPAKGATLWSSNYNSSLDTSASWGPYKLAEFEPGSYYKLVKNDNWYGWNMEYYKNQYNISAIHCRKVTEFPTIWMGFLNGTYDDAALASENIADYKDSKYVTYDRGSATNGMQLYSNLRVLKESGNNNGILAILPFRQALSLALDRSDVVEKQYPGVAVASLGLLNTVYYYDIENSPNLEDGGVYRNSVQAKEGLLRAYGYTQAADGTWSSGSMTGMELEEAYYSLTGYNPTLARERFQEAIDILTADPEYYGYDATKDITILFGSSVDNASQRERCDFLQELIDGLAEGTILEGKIKLVFDASAGKNATKVFRAGQTQIGYGWGLKGDSFNPFYFVGNFVDPDRSLNYHKYWNTNNVDLTIKLPEGDYECAGEELTMSLLNWYYCMNGLGAEKNQKYTYNWDAGYAPAEARMTIMAAVEEVVLKQCYSVILFANYEGTFLSGQFSHFKTDAYNEFMGFGGLRYMVVEYTDEEWVEFVAQNNNNLANEYKKTE